MIFFAAVFTNIAATLAPHLNQEKRKNQGLSGTTVLDQLVDIGGNDLPDPDLNVTSLKLEQSRLLFSLHRASVKRFPIQG